MEWYNTEDIFIPDEEEFELNRTEQPVVCAAHVNVLGENIHTIKKNEETWLTIIKSVV
jgi:hypothetical protein